MGERFDQHGLADLAGLDAFSSGGEIGIEATHETKLQQHAVSPGGLDDDREIRITAAAILAMERINQEMLGETQV